MTPRSLGLVFAGQAMRLDREHNDRAWLAWHIAAFMRMKRLPRFASLLSRKRQNRKRQTPAEQLAIIKMHHAALGGSVKRLTH